MARIDTGRVLRWLGLAARLMLLSPILVVGAVVLAVQWLLGRRFPELGPVVPSGGYPCSPRDWRDAEAWHAYWQGCLDGSRSLSSMALVSSFGMVIARDLVDGELAEPASRAGRSVLLVGNGLDQLPRVLACAGFRVVALDLSTLATDAAAAFVPDDAFFARYTSLWEPATASRWWLEGGSVTFVAGDLFDHDVAPGPFDIIISIRSLQGFTPDDARAAATAIDARLAAYGLVIVAIVNPTTETMEKVGEPFRALGYGEDEERPGGKRLRMMMGSGLPRVYAPARRHAARRGSPERVSTAALVSHGFGPVEW